ncbi:MAG: protein kinase [Polyangia bacterium]|jgi:serine/threonine-protein kinase|nr:protein kinase [Polyangia bacterium]
MAAPPGAAAAPDDGKLEGKKLNNRYLVLAHIGEGGFGDVYKAKQIQMDRDVAIKVLSPGMTKDPKLVERFKREAKSACNLRDPHTIITYDFDETDNGLLYIAMELLQGETLYDVLEREGPMPANRVVGILEQTCSSLGEAHVQGIVHRDMKPENIFLEARPDHPDFVKVLDFGIAKIVGGEMAQGPALTAAGQTLGTLEYMSPEQLMGQKLDGRSDIYALGMLMYQMLTGSLPFGQNASPTTMIQWHLREQPKPPSQVVPGCPPDLDPILFRMLDKDRDKRYPTVMELRQDLQQLMARHGWLAGGVSGPMTAVPPVALPSFPQGPAPGMAMPAGPAAGSPGPMSQGAPPRQAFQGGQPPPQTMPVTVQPRGGAQSKGKGKLVVIIVAVLLALGLAGGLVYWFVLRDEGGGGSKAEEKGKDAMSAMAAKSDEPMKARPDSKRPPADRPSAGREQADRPPARRDGASDEPASPPAPSLGGLLGALKDGGGKDGGDKDGAGGLGSLIGGAPELPAPGRILVGRRARHGIKASEDDPLRVVPPEMTLVARIDLAPFRNAPWLDGLIKQVPQALRDKAKEKLSEAGIALDKVRSLAMGGIFPEGKGEEPILMFVLSGAVDSKALGRVFREGKAKAGTERIAGYQALVSDDGRLVMASPALTLLASDKVVKLGLSRMSQPKVAGFLDAGWAPKALKDSGASASPHLVAGVTLPDSARKATGELIVQLKAGAAADQIKNLVLALEATDKGIKLTLAAECSSSAVATKLGAFLPLVLKMAEEKLPAALKPILGKLKLGSADTILFARMDLTGDELSQLAGLVAGIAGK